MASTVYAATRIFTGSVRFAATQERLLQGSARSKRTPLDEVFFTTPHFDGYSAVLMRIPDLARIDREELREMIVEAWLTRAQKRVAKAWLAEHGASTG